MVIPRALREQAGVAEGTLMKIAVVEGRQFLVTPQVTIDRSIVESPRKNRKQLLKELGRTVDDIRQEAKEKGIDKMTRREINAAVSWARRELKKSELKKKTRSRPAK